MTSWGPGVTCCERLLELRCMCVIALRRKGRRRRRRRREEEGQKGTKGIQEKRKKERSFLHVIEDRKEKVKIKESKKNNVFLHYHADVWRQFVHM